MQKQNSKCWCLLFQNCRASLGGSVARASLPYLCGHNHVYNCLSEPLSCSEVCMIISVPDSSDCSAVVLETVLQTAQGEVVEHMAALFEAGRSLADLWAVVQGRPVSLSHEATEGYVDGFSVPIALPLTPHSRQCVSYWLHQGSFAQQSTSIDFRGVIEAFEWLDAHFFLPRYDLPDAWPFLPASLSWTCNRWEPSIAGTKVRIYSDRFHVLAPAGIASGAGIAAFVFAHGSWKFAGAIIEQRFKTTLHHMHVKAHSGEPGNELVDTLAHQAALGWPLHDLQDWVQHALRSTFVSQIEWAWFLFRPDVQWDGHCLLLPAAPTTTPVSFDRSQKGHLDEPRAAETLGTITLKLLTCNVLTLLPPKVKGVSGAESGPARQDSLLRQLDEADIHVFGFKETRLRRLSNAHDSRFWLFKSSATSHGHYGIMVGLTRNKPIGQIHQGRDIHDVFIRQEDASDPRFLVLRLKTVLFQVIIIFAHAPHTGAADAVVTAWWREVADVIPERYNMWPHILLVDANARVGTEPCHHIGLHQAEPSNGKDDGFTQFVRTQGLFLPATFSSCHDGAGGTWLHPQGTVCRNDYIGLPIE